MMLPSGRRRLMRSISVLLHLARHADNTPGASNFMAARVNTRSGNANITRNKCNKHYF